MEQKTSALVLCDTPRYRTKSHPTLSLAFRFSHCEHMYLYADVIALRMARAFGLEERVAQQISSTTTSFCSLESWAAASHKLRALHGD